MPASIESIDPIDQELQHGSVFFPAFNLKLAEMTSDTVLQIAYIFPHIILQKAGINWKTFCSWEKCTNYLENFLQLLGALII
jgi:hypothetical protein